MSQEKYVSPGPVFEAKPGWGGKLKKFLKADFKKKILSAAAIFILLIGVALLFSKPSRTVTEKHKSKVENISVTVRPGDGIIAVARRALEVYLKEKSEVKLLPEQKIYIDNFFKSLFGKEKLAAGQEIKFAKTDLDKAVKEALALPESKLVKLREYLK